jgi:hypothetical protein
VKADDRGDGGDGVTGDGVDGGAAGDSGFDHCGSRILSWCWHPRQGPWELTAILGFWPQPISGIDRCHPPCLKGRRCHPSGHDAVQLQPAPPDTAPAHRSTLSRTCSCFARLLRSSLLPLTQTECPDPGRGPPKRSGTVVRLPSVGATLSTVSPSKHWPTSSQSRDLL